MHDCCPKKQNIFVWMLEAVPGIFTHFQEIWFLLFLYSPAASGYSFFFNFRFFFSRCFFSSSYFLLSDTLFVLRCCCYDFHVMSLESPILYYWQWCYLRLIYIHILCSPGIHYWYHSRYVWLLFIIYVYSTPSVVRGNEHYRSPQTVRCSCYLLTIDIIITIMFTFVLVYLIHCVSFLLLSLALPWNRR